MARHMNLYFRVTSALLLSACLSSCVSNYEYTGLKISSENFDKIKKSRMSQQDLIEFVGSPTFSSELGGNTWYYVHTVTDKVAFFRPVLVDEEVIAIKFNTDGSFANIKKYTQDDINNFSFSDESTPTLGTEANPIQQVMKNIQKYSVPSFTKKTQPGG